KTISPMSFREDHSGNLWIGLASPGGLVRIRHGYVERFTTSDGVPSGAIVGLICDSKERLWIASSEGGLGRVDQPDAAIPVFQIYTTDAGLSSNQIWSIVEDDHGYIYAGTGRGLNRVDPSGPIATDSIKRFTAADGFPRGEIRAAYRDRNGVL